MFKQQLTCKPCGKLIRCIALDRKWKMWWFADKPSAEAFWPRIPTFDSNEIRILNFVQPSSWTENHRCTFSPAPQGEYIERRIHLFLTVSWAWTIDLYGIELARRWISNSWDAKTFHRFTFLATDISESMRCTCCGLISQFVRPSVTLVFLKSLGASSFAYWNFKLSVKSLTMMTICHVSLL
jgi:hypothetical protein